MEFKFATLLDFLLMDGHGPYVWASYIVTALALGALVIQPYLKKRQLLIQIQRQQRIEER